MDASNVPWPTFQGREMLDLLSFLQKQTSGMRQESRLLPASPTKGKALFSSKGCASCHAVDGETGKPGPALGSQRDAPPSLAQFAGLMWNHSPQMLTDMRREGIPRPQFAEGEMADLIAYLHWAHYLEPVGRVDLGSEVFHAMHCSNCHGADGHGGRDGPNLVRRQAYYASQLAYTLWTHGPQMYRRMREKNIPWPTLSEKELVDLIAFLNSI